MLEEKKILEKIIAQQSKEQKRTGVEYVDHSFSALNKAVLERYKQEKEKKIGFSSVEGRNSSVLISGSHSMGLIEFQGIKVSPGEVASLNELAKNRKERYQVSGEGNLLVGKQYLNGKQRGRGDYKADTNVGVMCVELWKELADREGDSAPGLLLYELPQIFSEPNKVDAKNKGLEVVELEIYEKVGAKKLMEYILVKGVDDLKVRDISLLRNGRYSQIAELEADQEKKEALLECEKILEKIDHSGAEYKEAIASLGILKVHRAYYEQQEVLLYQDRNKKRPINLEIHTCFDTIKSEEDVDLVIGTRFSSSVAEPEMELILGLILARHGFNVGLSTLNSLPSADQEKEASALENFIDLTSQGPLLSQAEKAEMERLISIVDEKYLEEELRIIFQKRIDQIFQKPAGEKIIIKYLKAELDKNFDAEKKRSVSELATLSWDIYGKKISNLSKSEKLLKLKQETLNLFLSARFNSDRLREGLSGLSSLSSKFKAREKYPRADGALPLPAIFQIEIVRRIMDDPRKRERLQLALKDFVKRVDGDDFNPKKELEELLN